MLPCGKSANQALAARRAGADVTLVAAVRYDALATPLPGCWHPVAAVRR
jgi:hypothetical protein